VPGRGDPHRKCRCAQRRKKFNGKWLPYRTETPLSKPSKQKTARSKPECEVRYVSKILSKREGKKGCSVTQIRERGRTSSGVEHR